MVLQLTVRVVVCGVRRQLLETERRPVLGARRKAPLLAEQEVEGKEERPLPCGNVALVVGLHR